MVFKKEGTKARHSGTKSKNPKPMHSVKNEKQLTPVKKVSKAPIKELARKDFSPKKEGKREPTTKNRDIVEEKVYECLQKYDDDRKGIDVIDSKFIKEFKAYLDKYFKDYEIELDTDMCILNIDGFEITIQLD